MINDDTLPRPITADEVRIGDKIERTLTVDGVKNVRTLTVARIGGRQTYSAEGGILELNVSDATYTLLSRTPPPTLGQIAYEELAKRSGWVTAWAGHGGGYRASWEAAVDKAIAEHEARKVQS